LAPTGAWIWFLGATMLVRHIVRHASLSSEICHSFLAACTVACVYHGTMPTLLGRASVVSLGRVSYSFYLYAVVTLNVLIPVMTWEFGSPQLVAHWLEYGILVSLLTVATTIPLAIQSGKWIERPFIVLGRRLTGSSRNDAPQVTLAPTRAVEQGRSLPGTEEATQVAGQGRTS
jgi:peptidoglycan/LPS O-acetylase OafA/YrhL